MKVETNIKLLNLVCLVLLVAFGYASMEAYKVYKKVDNVIQKVEKLGKFTPSVPKFPFFGEEPEPEVEYIAVEPEPKEPWIDPNKVPINGPMWYLKPVDTIETLVPHIEKEHGVKPHQVIGWYHHQLKKLHSYLHNGGKPEDLY
jgi:hypothetical protein